MAKKNFKAESKRLLDLMINSIYTNRDIFLREIISNASDATDKLHYVSLTDETARSVMKNDPEIRISVDKDAKTITVTDHGIGMNAEELENNLGTIAKSGSKSFKESLPEDDDAAIDIIGQFGVGFYSAFMVADHVTVRTKRFDSETAYEWESAGADGYTVTECDKEDVGTEVVMHIKDDTDDDNYSDYLNPYTIRRIVKTYSDYVRYPIKTEIEKNRQVDGENGEKKNETYFEDETLNSMVPLWKRNKKDIPDEEYNNFFKDTFYSPEDPITHIHLKAEGIVSYNALLYIPSSTPFDYYTKDYKKGLRLYSNGVMIMDSCEDLLPDHFRFVKGVIDSDDLSLNISREILQQDRQLKTIATNIEKKIKSELKRLMDNEREKYEKFFSVFGTQLKYGVASDYGIHKEMLSDLLLFYSMKEEKLVTLNEYVAKMPESQPHIYYACGKNISNITSLPQAELVRDKGYDMLCLTDDADEFVVQILGKVNEKDFRSINADDSGLTDDAESKNAEQAQTENSEMLGFLKEKISGLSDIVVSKKLKSQPVCLSAKGAVTIETEKYFAAMPGDAPKPKAERVLELNPNHKVFETLKTAYAEQPEKAAQIAEILYAQALLIAGLPIENPAEYSQLVCSLL